MDTCWLQGSSTHVSVYKPRLKQPRYSHALVGCTTDDSRCGIFVNMAAKKSPSKSSIVSAKKKPESSLKKQTAVNEIAKAKKVMSGLGKGGSGLGRIAYEVTGAGDLKRFAKNPSLKNAANLGVTVAAYAAPGIAKGVQSAAAMKAAKSVQATKQMRAASAASRAASTSRVIKPLGGTAQATTRGGGSMAKSNISKIVVKKSPTRAAASSKAATNRATWEAAQTAAIRKEPLVTRAKMAASAVAGGKAVSGQNANKQNKKNKKK